jgi:hypothetical protein
MIMINGSKQYEFDTPLYDPPVDGDRHVPALNCLLRGELAAVESYDQVLEKYAEGPAIAELRQIRIDHYSAVKELRDRIHEHGGHAVKSSGAWGVFAGAVTGAAKMIGLQTVIAALRQGEERGVSDYEQIAQDKEMSPESRWMIESELLPKCRGHVATLKQLAAAN